MSFPGIELPHGFTTRELVSWDEKNAETAKLHGGPVGWLHMAFLGVYDASGNLATIVVADHAEKKIHNVETAMFQPLPDIVWTVVETILARMDYALSGVTRRWQGRVMGADGVFHALDAMPDDLHVRGDLHLMKSDGPVRLPCRRLRVDGRLTLRDCDVRSFPRDFLHVAETMDLFGTDVVALPKNTFVGSDFSPSEMTETLPSGLTVGSYLKISYTRITELPPGSTCRHLLMKAGQLARLPESFRPETLVSTFGDGEDTTAAHFRLAKVIGSRVGR